MNHRSKKNILGFVLAGMTSIAAMTTPTSADTFALRVGAGHPAALAYVGQLKEFFLPELAKRVEERTEHKITYVEAYGGSVAKLPEVYDAVESGLLDIGALSTPFEPSSMFLMQFGYKVPFVSNNAQEMFKVGRAVFNDFPPLAESMAKHNQILLAMLASSSYSIILNKEVTGMEDLNGLKIAGGGANLDWLSNVGVVPVQAPLGEAYNSLQTGVLDGYLVHLQGMNAFKLHEVAPYIFRINFMSNPSNNLLSIRKQTFDSFPPEVQAIVLEVAAEYEERVNTIHAEDDGKALATMIAGGATEFVVSDADRAKWAKAISSIPQAAADDGVTRGEPMAELLTLYLEKLDEAGIKLPVQYTIK
ncbi:TRAP-type C4-dicarboxylate transport system, periplasmic component [Hoeflea sp. IMCC20628]|uniref:C4-dicarboxylate TRAP transporter substrate-binding protein n=1 Tax=Hoeflea sp. IMCC20628 TaxID=1620421 RepID=UPI00063ABD22|nr:C4-dicarboxylate TRAP transporter substrate-binding protein [Hoeflea sp. IMCC20628]AKH98904.1 TRAP-type C4-dicarboxylate transport system, periplasmic component [Hoeflea sp. IMCC20628]